MADVKSPYALDATSHFSDRFRREQTFKFLQLNDLICERSSILQVNIVVTLTIITEAKNLPILHFGQNLDADLNADDVKLDRGTYPNLPHVRRYCPLDSISGPLNFGYLGCIIVERGRSTPDIDALSLLTILRIIS